MPLPSELFVIIRQWQCVYMCETKGAELAILWLKQKAQKGVKPKTCSINIEAMHIATNSEGNLNDCEEQL